MNSLLKRQIRKYLPQELQSNEDLERFLDAVDKSYTTSEEQFLMLQRATKFSSEELFFANEQLREESDSQKKVISKLESVIDKLQFYDLKNNRPKESVDSLKLVDFIDDQTKEIIKINQQKDKLLRNLERQNQELNDYAHMVSHDLKSPLQSIEALTAWVLEDYSGVLDAAGKENLQFIRDNVEKMDTLVKGILEYSTIGRMEKDIYDVNLNDLVNNLKKKEEKLNSATYIIPERLPTIKGDKFRLEQLFLHLLDNAVKFNDKKEPTVEIGFTEDSDFWKFYIEDNGNGIDNKYFDKIFVAFQKLEDDYKSTGIGLSIVKKIVEVYNGEIYLKSEQNVGSTFYFSIKK
ncbi:GHKL domain-containing protein [Polaribacter sp. R2A056_3_33]|uniref:sensor histidine kinase n=1 Tax=Polaribacter sp. R2A056_3_33 TaxID=2745563 RepID=UPI001C4F499C|nr:ATP-binding protein [Polaribacter sp. R2A056_3_33]QXP69747.1 GHKL domain-containing protein [Polaribacter sp. R2A056_3_33]